MQGFGRFLAYRLVRLIFALWAVVTVVFVVMRLSGDPVPLLLPPDAPIAEMERLRHEMGLDRPIYVQYGVFINQAIRGDFGRSIHFRVSAIRVAWERVPATLELSLAAFLCAIVVAVPAGVFSAIRRGSIADHLVMGVALIGQAAPTFYIGIMLILVCSLWMGLFPTSGRGDWRQLVLPAITLGAFAMASIARITRSAVLEILRADFIRTARAKGVPEFWTLAKHTMRNAAVPIVTIVGLQLGNMLGGAVVTETIFSWPGIGRLAIQSIFNRDYPVVQSCVFLTAAVFVVLNFLVDLTYGVLDPRIRRQ
ncbi:MAG: Oligopeptide transporter permease protein [candidate division NC10 bacterium]|nr:Oligopeptide transporter permease protein [candidate division NC10 bacterium]